MFALVVLSVPALVKLRSRPPSQASENMRSFLPEVELLLLGIIAEGHVQHSPSQWREVCSALANVAMLQGTTSDRSSDGVTALLASSLGKQPRYEVSTVLTFTITASQTGITLRREMLDSIQTRLSQGIMPNDLAWPSHPYQAVTATGAAMSAFWQEARSRYIANLNPGSMHDISIVDQLPAEWSALTLHLSADKQSLLAVKLEHDRKPLILQLPLDRLGRREGEDHLLSFDLSKGELLDIIKASNETCRMAKDVTTTEGRKAWWKQRKELDMRLATLLVNIDERWLGAFKVSLSDFASLTGLITFRFTDRSLRFFSLLDARHEADRPASTMFANVHLDNERE
jgi:separase